MLGRRVVSSKDHHSPHKEGLAKVGNMTAQMRNCALSYVYGT